MSAAPLVFSGSLFWLFARVNIEHLRAVGRAAVDAEPLTVLGRLLATRNRVRGFLLERTLAAQGVTGRAVTLGHEYLKNRP